MKLNVEQTKRRRSVFVTIEQLRGDLRPVISSTLKDTVDDILYDRGSNAQAKESTAKNLNHMLEFNSWHNSEVIEMWCEICSETFFHEHSSYDDVLIANYMDNSGTITDATWLASRINIKSS